MGMGCAEAQKWVGLGWSSLRFSKWYLEFLFRMVFRILNRILNMNFK